MRHSFRGRHRRPGDGTVASTDVTTAPAARSGWRAAGAGPHTTSITAAGARIYIALLYSCPVQTLDRLDVAAALAQLVALLPRLAPRGGLSLTATATLGELEREGPRRVTDLAEGQGVSQPAMTGLVRRLAAQGLVERAPDPTDGRGVLVAVTPAGSALLADRRRARAEVVAELVDRLPPDDRAALAGAAPALTHLVQEGRS